MENEKEITVLCEDASKRLANGEATINQIRQEFGLQPIDDKNAETRFVSPCNINILAIGGGEKDV